MDKEEKTSIRAWNVIRRILFGINLLNVTLQLKWENQQPIKTNVISRLFYEFRKKIAHILFTYFHLRPTVRPPPSHTHFHLITFYYFFLPAFAAFITRVICTHCRWIWYVSECIFMFESNGLTEFNKKCNGNVQIEWWLQCHNFSITCINSFGKKFGHDQWIWISVNR